MAPAGEGLRQQCGAAPLAGSGSGDDAGVPAGQYLSGGLWRAWGGGRGGALGATGVAVHRGVLGHGRGGWSAVRRWSVVAVLLRLGWRSVSDIVTRVVAARAGQLDRLAGLRRISSMRFLAVRAGGPRLSSRGAGL